MHQTKRDVGAARGLQWLGCKLCEFAQNAHGSVPRVERVRSGSFMKQDPTPGSHSEECPGMLRVLGTSSRCLSWGWTIRPPVEAWGVSWVQSRATKLSIRT